MADSPNQSTEVVAGPPADASPQTAPARIETPVGPPIPEPDPYRPLSLLAVGGFVLAAGYAFFVGLGGVGIFAYTYPRLLVLLTMATAGVAALVAWSRGPSERERLGTWVGLALGGLYTAVGLAGLVAFSGTNPWVLPPETILIPIAAALICWMARSRIQASEGTLAGNTLAGWGLGLSIFFGLNYAAYLASNQFAVRTQASEFADRWIDFLRQGKVEDAFAMTIPIANRPEGTPSRSDIEIRFNAPRPTGGSFSQFSRAPYVQQLVMGGSGAKIELTGVSSRLEEKFYRIVLTYRVTTEFGKFDLDVPAQGSESVGQGGTGRTWQILAEGVQMNRVQPTELGEGLGKAAGEASELMRDFVPALQSRNLARMYLDTLPKDQREAQALLAVPAAGWPAAGFATALRESPEGQAFQRELAAFQKGTLVQARPEEFWAPMKEKQDQREEILAAVRDLFRPGSAQGPEFAPVQGTGPTIHREDGRFQFHYPVSLRLTDPGVGPRFLIEAEVVVGGSPTAENQAPTGPWQVRSINLIRAHTPPAGRVPGS